MYLFTVSQICCFIDFFAFSIWTVRPVFEQCDQYLNNVTSIHERYSIKDHTNVVTTWGMHTIVRRELH